MGTTCHVLVVDDEPGVLHFVKSGLSLSGFEVTTTTSGEEALQLLQVIKPDVVLLDILMSPPSGFDVLSRMRSFTDIPVIVFTARSDIGELALKEGANSVISKPFKPDALIKKIKETLKSY